MKNEMKNAYYWYSPRGFANEGTIFVIEQYKAEDLESKLDELVSKNPTNALWNRITRKQAQTDKDFLATDGNYYGDNTFEERLVVANQFTTNFLDE